MTLNLTETARLKTALDAQNSFFYWLKNDVTNISNNVYATIRADFEAWNTAAGESNLYITTGNGVELSGITSVPIPPAR